MVRASCPMILKVVGMKVTGSNPVCASIINKLTYKHVEEAEHVALLNHIKYDIITVTEFLK